MIKDNTIVVAIIGVGPRGLSALESLYAAVISSKLKKKVQVLLFEQTGEFGNGAIYSMDQPDTNWLNVSERGLTIPERNAVEGEHLCIPKFPSFQDWTKFDAAADTGSSMDKFPLRSVVGEYLRQRYQSIAEKLMEKELLEISEEKVIDLNYEKATFTIATDTVTYHADEVVLTIGHQPTFLDEQMSTWKTKSDGNAKITLITNPYPVSNSISTVKDGDVVALRGFGLAMIDVARALTEGLGGSFELIDERTRKMTYRSSSDKKVHLVPFSLDGLPMTPKPLNLDLDKPFIPSDEELGSYNKQLENSVQLGEKVSGKQFLITTITPIIVQKFLALGVKAKTHNLSAAELEEIVKTWFKDENTKHDLIVSKSLSAYKSMQAFVDMASGNAKVSLDYCIGQVWRHCQPSMYKALSFTDLKDELIAEIIELDERLKRYSYGPPVDSLTQMLALVDAGIMNFDLVKDPDISFSDKGWQLSKRQEKVMASVMVNSVLDFPKLLEVKSPLVQSLLNDGLVEPVHTKLGISTYQNAIVDLNGAGKIVPLAVLGRLAKGTIIGVDSILESLGERSEFWADGLVKRIRQCETT